VSAFSGALASGLKPNDNIMFDAKEILTLLNQPGCASIRAYFVKNDQTGQPSVVLVAVDSGDKNITTNNILVEYGAHNSQVL
jgi:hypothetical protein